jgi:hypothetical protein
MSSVTTMTLLRLSLLLNVFVLVPVLLGLATRATWAETVYGPASPARGILVAVYAAILLLSLAGLLRPRTEAVATLLLMQVLYKVLTAWTVGTVRTVRHPVVASNLGIAFVHVITLVSIWRSTGTR